MAAGLVTPMVQARIRHHCTDTQTILSQDSAPELLAALRSLAQEAGAGRNSRGPGGGGGQA